MNKPMTKKEWLAFLKKTIEEFDWDAEHSEKPIAWTDEDFTQLIVSEDIAKDIGATVPLYASPPKREWQGLTDEEIDEGQRQSWVEKQAFESAVWWAEAKLKEKNK